MLEPNTLDFISHSEAQTRRLGARLAAYLKPGDVLALVGDLGSGKTRWVQGVCAGLSVTDPVISPTFTLVNEYQGLCPVYHIDLYRLADAAETATFGLEDYLYGSGITIIEWADRAKTLLPIEHLTIELYHLEETKRRVVLRPHGQRFLTLLDAFKHATFAQQRQP
ncbi:MAG: tRNA (adenosine(37)-N6)-threonylcarbamoyltransferase complex ATPase subunit type 1 TsaE [Anaerolineales bacterium]|nr:tRNA (adenosine(37)-N6)-threonylcarbamoyltransferase complex ATPase subunit type 1 TsaE [Anaerolineales bacterium]